MRDRRTISVGLTDTILAGPNERRVAFIISAPSTNRFTVDFAQPAVLDQGFNVYPGTLPMMVLDDRFGQALREEIHCISSGVAQNVTVLDIFEK